MADFKALQADLDGVLAKVNTWSASKEKNLSDLKVSHNTFLDTQNGVHSILPGFGIFLLLSYVDIAEYTNELKQREKQAKNKMEKISQGRLSVNSNYIQPESFLSFCLPLVLQRPRKVSKY